MLSTIQPFFAYEKRRILNLITQYSAEKIKRDPVEICVVDGPQESSNLTLTQASFVVGPTLDADVFLAEPSEEQRCVTLSMTKTPIGTYCNIQTVRDDVILNGDPIGASKESHLTRLPLHMRIGKHALSLQVTRPSGRATHRQISLTDATLAIAVCALCLLTFNAFWTPAPPRFNFDEISPAQLTDSNEVNLLTKVNERIATASLDQYLVAERRDAATIQISGRIPERLMVRWDLLHRQLDESLEDQVLLVKVWPQSSLVNLAPIVAVQLTPQPEIFFRDGSVVRVGDELKDGWRLSSVSDRTFVVTKDQEQLMIKY